MTSYLRWEHELNFEGTAFPITVGQIPQFEKLNPTLAINIFNWIGNDKLDSYGARLPPLEYIRKCSGKKGQSRTIVNIIKNNDHYYGVVNLNRVLNSGQKKQRFWCERCIRPFYNQEALTKHRIACYEDKRQVEIMPTPGKNKLNFTNWNRTMPPLFCAYADTECLLVETATVGKLQHHEVCAVGYIVIPDPKIEVGKLPDCVGTYRQFIGPDCILQFLADLEAVGRILYGWAQVNTHEKMEYVPNINHLKNIFDKCQLCNVKFNSPEERYADHDHLAGKFKNAICHTCNSNLRLTRWTLPIVMHNLKNYDTHVLCINGFGKMKGWNYSVIPQTSERYLGTDATFVVADTFPKKTYFHLKFLDSFQFLSAGLASLVSKLPRDKFVHLHAS